MVCSGCHQHRIRNGQERIRRLLSGQENNDITAGFQNVVVLYFVIIGISTKDEEIMTQVVGNTLKKYACCCCFDFLSFGIRAWSTVQRQQTGHKFIFTLN